MLPDPARGSTDSFDSAAVDETHTEPADGPSETAGAPADTERADSLLSWFHEVLTPSINRDTSKTSNLVWCSSWWAHPEAVARICALHEAWTVLVDDVDAPGDGASNWWVNHVDFHLSVLLDTAASPFSRCARGHSDEIKGLTSTPPPEGGLRIPRVAGPGPTPPDAGEEAERLDAESGDADRSDPVEDGAAAAA